MLTLLSLRDFAVVRAAELRLGPGMTVVSGETGAGKSLLVDALLWLSGARADSGMVRAGAARSELAAEFDLADAPAAAAWLAENALDEDGQCQLRRVVKADGGSKAWINGRAVTLAQLAELASLLVGIHGQHEHQALLDRQRQLALLDAFGRHADLLAPVRAHASEWAEAERAIRALEERGDVGDRIDYLRHQLQELEAEALDSASIEALVAGHRRAAHAGALLEACSRAAALLSDEDGAASATGPALALLARWTDTEPRLAEVVGLVESARVQLGEASRLLDDLRDGLDLDPESLAQLDQRLSRLHELARKHRVGLAGLETRREALRTELEELEGAGNRLAALVATREAAARAWSAAAAALSTARQRQASTLAEAVTALMQELGMAGGRFEVALEALADARPQPGGAERIEFFVGANPGQPTRPLRKVASGGELARISLAIEVATLGLDDTPTMVFDEVDSGIGGAVAEIVGRLLRRLGASRQVLCVTHLPQVAAQGHAHYRVSKTSEGGDTSSAPQALDANGRIEEIARMLGGVDITAAVRTSARQMIERASREAA